MRRLGKLFEIKFTDGETVNFHALDEDECLHCVQECPTIESITETTLAVQVAAEREPNVA